MCIRDSYLQGRCQAMTSDRSQLAAARSGFNAPEAHVILEDRLSKEPLAPAVVGGDQRLVDAMTWVVYALIEAEERGITQANLDRQLRAAEADPSQAEFTDHLIERRHAALIPDMG